MDENCFSVQDSAESPGLALWQTTMVWQRRLKKILDPYGLSHAQFVLMAILLWFEHTKRCPSQVDLIQQSKLDKMTVSKSLKKLESLGYVARLQGHKDSRIKQTKLTLEGKKLASELVKLIEAEDACFFNQINSENQKQLLGCLLQLCQG